TEEGREIRRWEVPEFTTTLTGMEDLDMYGIDSVRCRWGRCWLLYETSCQVRPSLGVHYLPNAVPGANRFTPCFPETTLQPMRIPRSVHGNKLKFKGQG